MDKFEQITNPVGESNFEFQFEDVAPQGQNQDQKSDFPPVVLPPDSESNVSETERTPEFSPEDFRDSAPIEESIPEDLIIDMDQRASDLPPVVSASDSVEQGPIQENSFDERAQENSQIQEDIQTSDSTPMGEDITSESISYSDQGEISVHNDAFDQAQEQNSDLDTEQVPLVSQEVQAHQDLEQEPTTERTKLMQKFVNLLTSAKDILRLQRKLQQNPEMFELSGGTTSKSQVSYAISLDQDAEIPLLHIKKYETFTDSHEQVEHLLSLTSETPDENLKIMIDNEPLYVENIDLLEGNKPVFVSEKLNKFEFFFADKQKELSEQRELVKIEKEKKA